MSRYKTNFLQLYPDEYYRQRNEQFKADRQRRYDVLNARTNARKQRRYQLEDQQRQFDLSQLAADEDMRRKLELQQADLQGRYGLQAQDIQGRFGLQRMEGQQALERGQQQYGFQRGLAEQGHGFHLGEMGYQADIEQQSQDRLFAHQDEMQFNAAGIAEEMAYTQASLDEVKSQLDQVRTLQNKAVDFGYGQQADDAALARQKQLTDHVNELTKQNKELEHNYKVLDEQKKRLEDRRDATTAYMRSPDYQHATPGEIASQNDAFLMHMTRHGELAAGLASGRYYYSDDQMRQMENLQKRRNEEATNPDTMPGDRSRTLMGIDRDTWAIEDNPMQRPMSEWRKTMGDQIEASIYEHPKYGPMKMGKDGAEILRNAPDPNAVTELLQKIRDNALSRADKEQTSYNSQLAARQAFIDKHTHDREVKSADGKTSSWTTYYTDKMGNEVSRAGMMQDVWDLFDKNLTKPRNANQIMSEQMQFFGIGGANGGALSPAETGPELPQPAPESPNGPPAPQPTPGIETLAFPLTPQEIKGAVQFKPGAQYKDGQVFKRFGAYFRYDAKTGRAIGPLHVDETSVSDIPQSEKDRLRLNPGFGPSGIREPIF